MSSSSSSIPRLKERGGAGGKITALKPQKTTTDNRTKDAIGSCKKPVGKENPRSLSAGRTRSTCQKPVSRPVLVPRTEKPAAAAEAAGSGKAGEVRAVRWSTSSLLKGKSSNPLEFSRFLSDRRKDRLEKGSAAAESDALDEIKKVNNFGVLEKCQLKKSNSCLSSKGDDEKSINCSVESQKGKISGLNSKEMVQHSVKVLDECKKVSFASNSKTNARKCYNGVDVLKLNLRGSACEKDVSHAENFKLEPSLLPKNEKALNGLSIKTTSSLERSSGEYLRGLENLESNSKGFDGKKDAIRTEHCKLNSFTKLNPDSRASSTESGNGLVGNVGSSGDTLHMVSNLKVRGEKSLNALKVLVNGKEGSSMEENKVGQTVYNYSSKLHEKLAYLESKVNRIASDIKRTKEMLDLNNPDDSKLILSDIQDKICGVEKAMGHVMDDSKGRLGSSRMVEIDKLHSRHSESNLDGKAGCLEKLVKSSKSEELEARLFPHHKLLRNRASLGNSAGKEKSFKPNLLEIHSNSVQEEESLSPIDENPIALEFLASLEKKHKEVGGNDGCESHDQLECPAFQEVDADGTAKPEIQEALKNEVTGVYSEEVRHADDEHFEDIDDREKRLSLMMREETEDSSADQLREIGRKSSTGGWFVSEGESVLLAHDDGSCSFHDITNSEEKSEFKPPAGISHNLWGDCWLIRAPDSDGCAGRYVVAASAGNTLDSGFCSWNFYTKDILAFHVEDAATSSRTALDPPRNRALHRRNTLSIDLVPANQQWWYKPSGPLLVSTASCQKVVSIYDIRDGDLVMQWEVQRPVLGMDYSSPLQWRNRGKVVIAESEAITLWDVNSLNPQSLLSVSSFGKKVSALHVNNTEAELGGGVRRRVSSSEAEGNDGVFCTDETINVLDFRLPSGVGLKITKHGFNSQAIFSYRDSIFLSCTDTRLSARENSHSLLQHFSLRKGKLISSYALPESNAHFNHYAITQVWGDSELVMAISGLGMFVFDASKDEAVPFSVGHGNPRDAREVIGPDDLYRPSFDYLGSRILLISRDRPALWKYMR